VPFLKWRPGVPRARSRKFKFLIFLKNSWHFLPS